VTATLKLIYHTAKVRLGFLIMACALAGIAMSPGSSPAAWQVAVLGIATLFASAAAGAFNQLYERDVDAVMRRTRERPFVTGRFRADGIWLGFIAKNFYRTALGPLMARRVKIVPAALFYLSYPLGLAIFAVQPSTSPLDAAWLRMSSSRKSPGSEWP
jgi:heme O synthase-like polyprenyltransferase